MAFPVNAELKMARPVNVGLIPAEMKALTNWLMWKYEDRRDSKGNVKKTKVPYQVNGKKAESTNPDTWASFENVINAFERSPNNFNGIGFVFSEDSGIMGLDFDHVRDPVSGEWNAEALDEITRLDSYAEMSPSGTGAHVICIAEIPGKRRRAGPREMYESGRYFTVTGNKIEGTNQAVRTAQTEVTDLYNKWFPTVNTQEEKRKKSPELSDADVLNLCRNAKNAEKFNRLYVGNIKGFPSQSEADLSLCSIMAFYTQNKDQLNKLFCGSKLFRDKWDREDYGTKTLEKAVFGLTEVYDPDNKSDSTQKNKSVRDILKNIQVPQTAGEKLDMAKEIISNNLMYLNESEAEGFIITDVRERFNLTRSHVDVLNKYYKEQKREQIKKETKDKNKQTIDCNEDIDIDEIDIPDEDKEAARLEAMDVLKNGEPIEYIRKTIEEYHVGDEKTEECICISIAGQSCLNTDGIQTSVNGESGSGKSHLMKIHMHLVPGKYKEVTSLSPKAAYYMDLKPGTIIFSDDTTPSEEMEEVIKRANTNYQEYTKHTIVRDGKRETFLIPPRINWYLTSVDSEVSMQLLNRQLTFNTSNDPVHKENVFKMQQDIAEEGVMPVIEITERVLVCRRIYEIIKSQMFKVKIPYAKDIEIEDKSNSRVFPMFLDMIKGYTIFFHEQRKTDDDGYLLATKDDYDKAKELFESQTEGIVSKLNDKERAILRFIKDHPRCIIQAIAERTGYSYATVRNILKGRPKSKSAGEGLLEKVKGLSISEETHTTNENENHCISKKAERFELSDKFDGWSLYTTKFISLKSEWK